MNGSLEVLRLCDPCSAWAFLVLCASAVMLIQYIHTFDTLFWVYEKKLYLVLRPDTYKVA